MNKKYFKVSDVIQDIQVRLRSGITVFFMAVATCVQPVPMAANDTTPASAVESVRVGGTVAVGAHIVDRIGLWQSLDAHGGDRLTGDERKEVRHVVGELGHLDVKSSFAEFDENNNEIYYRLRLGDELVLRVTQYIRQPSDFLVFSLEKSGKYIVAANYPVDGFANHAKSLIKNYCGRDI